MTKNYLSKHAEERLYERTFFNEKSILNLINLRSFFFLGTEIDSNVVHCLVYQKNTDEYFVVVKDEITNSVITILPLNYHHKFEFKLKKEYVEIDSEIKRRARLAAGSLLTCDDLKLKIKLNAEVIDKDGIGKTYEIKKINFSLEEYYKFINSSKKAVNILNFWRKKNKRLEVVRLSLSIGRESKVFEYDI